MSQPYMKVTNDFTKNFNETIKRFKNDKVLVGIPAEDTDRKPGADESYDTEIGNAALLAINCFGSAANNIPARDVMGTGIEWAQEKIADQFEKCASRAWKDGVSALSTYYERAGIIASNSVKEAINAQEGMEPLAKSTLATRKSQGFSGTKALIVTGQMRNAITYVVKGGA